MVVNKMSCHWADLGYNHLACVPSENYFSCYNNSAKKLSEWMSQPSELSQKFKQMISSGNFSKDLCIKIMEKDYNGHGADRLWAFACVCRILWRQENSLSPEVAYEISQDGYVCLSRDKKAKLLF
jgi:hypothetical protein